jgi:hypothetical protein
MIGNSIGSPFLALYPACTHSVPCLSFFAILILLLEFLLAKLSNSHQKAKHIIILSMLNRLKCIKILKE